MSRNVVIAPGEYYHLYNRGVDKRNIFLTQADYERFSTLLYACNGSAKVDLVEQGKSIQSLLDNNFDRGVPIVDICAYVLMPNHFHIMIREITDKGTSKFMQKLGIAYTSYFNKKNDRTGSLFQGTFRVKHASEDPYCSYVASYIHLNPIKLIDPTWKESGIRDQVAAEKFLETYIFSSYLDYLGPERLMGLIINKTSLPSHCKASGDFKIEVRSWITSKSED